MGQKEKGEDRKYKGKKGYFGKKMNHTLRYYLFNVDKYACPGWVVFYLICENFISRA